MTRLLVRVSLALLVLGLVFLAVVWRGINLTMDAPLQVSSSGQVFEVLPGSSARGVFRAMQAQGLLPSAEPVVWYLRVTHKPYRLHAGEYRLEPGMTPRTVLALFASGQVVRYNVTFPEGWTLAQVLAQLREQPALQQQLVSRDDVARVLALPAGMDPEGWVFPDTYQYHKGMSDADIIRMAGQEMKRRLDALWVGRDTGLPYPSAYEALIMASLVERETGVPEERAEIAGVFVRRLQQGMRLQTDPAVIYGLGAAFDGNLTRAQLREPGPYNTYLNAGLPPTPIASPGEDSLRAALHPAPGQALYFVARGDGTHVFSATLAEHEAAVQRYQVRQRRSDYRSRPPAQ